jgi:hypothetical protein
MRFLGGKWQKKNNGDSKGNRMSCFGYVGGCGDGGAIFIM